MQNIRRPVRVVLNLRWRSVRVVFKLRWGRLVRVVFKLRWRSPTGASGRAARCLAAGLGGGTTTRTSRHERIEHRGSGERSGPGSGLARPDSAWLGYASTLHSLPNQLEIPPAAS